MKRKWIASFLALGIFAGVLRAQGPSAAPNELIGGLTKALNVSPEQATGAAGAIFSAAKGKMNPSDWSKVSSAVPGVDQMMKGVAGGDAAGAGPSAAAQGAAGAAGAAG